MSLPVPKLPKYKHTLIGLNEEVVFRPFTNQEQKILLLAKESKGQDSAKSDILQAVNQIVSNCTFGKLDASTMTTFDLEDLFLRIRAKSVGELVNIRYRYDYVEDDKKMSKFLDVQINLDDVKIDIPENHERKFMLDDELGLCMKYPTLGILDRISTDEEMVIACIDYVYDVNEIYNASDYSKEELITFYNNIDSSGLIKIKRFFETMPVVKHVVVVDLGNGKTKEVVFKGLEDFFI